MQIKKNVYHQSIIILILICFTNFRCARSACTDTEWECDDGQCISEDFRCDGKVHCRDGSDEIAENCMHIHETCPKYAFPCRYGACIEGALKCNGVQDCADNSDELICNKIDYTEVQGRCTEDEMQCVTSKECINSNNICDGQVNCKDGSDEALELCIFYGCVSVGFQCSNGACISGSAKCNGTAECADASDEAWTLCKYPRKKTNPIVGGLPTPTPMPTPTPTPLTQTSDLKRCLIPNTPQMQELIFKQHPLNETIQPGSFVEDFDTIHIECKNQYSLKGQSSILCQDGKWNNDFPLCYDYCDGSRLRGVSIRSVCDYKTKFVECPKKIRPGTDIQINCAYGYTREPNKPQFLQCLRDGTFDKSPLRCELNCGRVAPYSQALSKNGIPIESSSAPWHVAIYESNSVTFDYICSGSIVSPRLIISAAHCFWDEPNLILRNYTEYQIIAGRSSSNYTTVNNDYTQIIEIQEIHTPGEYRGKNGRQRDDIAFIKLKSPLKFSETIAPICIRRDYRSFGDVYIQSNEAGFMTGFGLKNQLERLKMITLNYHECKLKSPADAPVADDKFCIFNNEGGSVCRGDSGGGFFKQSQHHITLETIYTIWGVISNTPTTTNDCTHAGEEGYVAVTNVYYMTPELKAKLEMAFKEDEKLF